MERRKYDVSYKQEAVRQVLENGRRKSEVSRELGLHVNTLSRWIAETTAYGAEAFPGKGKLRSEDEELRQLKRELADLREENAILKKAAAIFAKHQK
jgi:Transposase and inactivated derivatives